MTTTEVARACVWVVGNLLPWCVGWFVIMRWFYQELSVNWKQWKRIDGS
jgi:hypothetical protein